MNEIDDLKSSAQNGQLVVVAGAGTSLSLASRSTPSFTWPKLLESAFSYAEKLGKIDDRQYKRWFETIGSGDLDELLGAAEFVSRKLDGRSGLLYARWLESLFDKQRASSSSKMREAFNNLARSGVPICTLNYDTLIERCTKLPQISMTEHRKVLNWARREVEGVLHLHGVWDEPETIVLGVSDYNDATSDGFRTNLQKALSSFNRLLFIGCGDTLYDPNLSSLLDWMRTTLGAAGLQHYALVRNGEVDAKLRDAAWQGLVAPIGYGDNYTDLPTFISDRLLTASPSKRVSRKSRPNGDNEVVQQYRRYLVADCGKMTIEGVRADADTAKQKFDLEKLFVPLAVEPVPPEFLGSDPNREKKLKEWHKKNPSTLPFGHALSKGSRLALLALPGGGKTLLLKRLAVAYAEPSRRSATDDKLPDADLLPILIRCREWRDHINLPINAIITKIFEITGNLALRGLYEAIEARLKSGQVLLLVDGLDEVHNDGDRTTFVENLERFLDEHRRIKLVITSREAGFALVAPSLMRFCSRWRIAPLSEDAIRSLCAHWHTLMDGDGPDALNETEIVVETIFNNESLRRLAENPLLLTMLLVVKHGYGRLPPDRVSLYERAVEVLLDTWNIRGHAALNPREAVPQLAYIAYRLMEQGKQTATERELLSLIEECRREVPMVRHYAKDTPSEFLKRVELRSSLLLEAGKSLENGKTVPFYQFRHLTFQEYMSAIALVEGHYIGYAEDNAVASPLGQKVSADEWKEVVPMAAVLAKKRASSLIGLLLEEAEAEVERAIAVSFAAGEFEWNTNFRMPRSASRLTQCLVEEAEFSQNNLERAFRVVATFAHGCQSQENWGALLRGPFGTELFSVAWDLFVSDTLPPQAWMRNTVALMAYYRKPQSYWQSIDGVDELRAGLTAASNEERNVAAATICGLYWALHEDAAAIAQPLQGYLEANLASAHGLGAVYHVWALALMFARPKGAKLQQSLLSPATLSRLIEKWISHVLSNDNDVASFAITATGLENPDWSPTLDAEQSALVRNVLLSPASDSGQRHSDWEGAAVIAYRAKLQVDGRLALQALGSRYVGSLSTIENGDILRYLGATDDEINQISQNGRLSRKRKSQTSTHG